jgi:hypothetical protein
VSKLYLLGQMRHVPLPQRVEEEFVERVTVITENVVENAPVGPPGERHARHGVLAAHQVLAGAVHRPHPGAAGQHERTVDVEQDEMHYAGEGEE